MATTKTLADLGTLTSIEEAVYAAAWCMKNSQMKNIDPIQMVINHRKEMALDAWRSGKGEFPATDTANKYAAIGRILESRTAR